jgi:hypothetical protein
MGGISMLENTFQANLIVEIKERLPGCMVLKNDPTYIQGIPDLLVLHKKRWAALECKKSMKEKRQPNQEYYVDVLGKMSFGSFICPENKEEVLNELQQAFRVRGAARLSKSKQIPLG